MPTKPATKPAGNGIDIERVANSGQRSLAVIAHLHSRAFRDALKFNAELLDFARRRVGANIETSDRLAHCTSVTEAVDVMAGFCRGAVQDYADESSALFRFSTEIASTSAAETVTEAQELREGSD